MNGPDLFEALCHQLNEKQSGTNEALSSWFEILKILLILSKLFGS